MQKLSNICAPLINISAIGLVIFIMAIMTNATNNFGTEPVAVESVRVG